MVFVEMRFLLNKSESEFGDFERRSREGLNQCESKHWAGDCSNTVGYLEVER